MVFELGSPGERVDKAWVVGFVFWCLRVLKRNFRVFVVLSTFLLFLSGVYNAVWKYISHVCSKGDLIIRLVT